MPSPPSRKKPRHQIWCEHFPLPSKQRSRISGGNSIMSDLSLSADPRWRRFSAGTWTCPHCIEKHRGVFDLACGKPEPWRGSEEKLPNSSLTGSNQCLTEDFCVLDGTHFFVRAVLPLAIIGSQNVDFCYGVWVTLSEKNFEIYKQTFDSGDQEGLGPWFGWFSNRLKGYPDTFNLKAQVHPRGGRQRPWIELESTEHPLAVEQREGITFDRLLDIYANFGHDIRKALLD